MYNILLLYGSGYLAVELITLVVDLFLAHHFELL